MQYEHLFRIFDGAVKELVEMDSYNMNDIAEVLLEETLPKILAMDKGEVPEDIREFFKNWISLHGGIEETEEAALPSGSDQEVLKATIEKYATLAGMMESVRKWIIEKSPRAIPPLIIFYALSMYNHALFMNRLYHDKDLFGAELPDKPHAHEDPEDPDEEDEDEIT